MAFETWNTLGHSRSRQGINNVKRLLVLLFGFGCLTTSFLYLRETTVYKNEIVLKTLDPEPQKAGDVEPQWTWICQEDHCERLHTSETSVLQSLATCNMLCASIQLWPQPTGPVSLATTAVPVSSDGDIYARWTWICEKNSCVRKHISNSSLNRQSLETCNMLCGSTLLWPQPTGRITLSSQTVPVRADDFSLVIEESSSAEVTEYLSEAFALMKEDLQKLERKNSEAFVDFDDEEYKKVEVHIFVDGDSDPRIRLITDESYKLTTKTFNDTLNVKIKAQSFCGARHGMETLSQLIWMDGYVGSLIALDAATIEDAPRFRIRGLLLDTARNFIPVSDILRTLDAMAANKLNTFQWHATDSQSFPLKLQSAPELAEYGAYSAKQVYTPQDIRRIVHRGRVRGIRIVIEVDAPAHVGHSWSYGPSSGLDDLAYCIERHPWNFFCGEPPCGQLNPTNPHVYEILEKIYKEIIDLTGEDEVFHLGGDEVNEKCWNTKFNEKARDLWLNFTNESLDRLEKANGGKLPEITIIWSSKLTQNPYLQRLDSKKLTIQLWGGSHWPEMLAILDAGFRTIISHVNAWYLDCGFGGWRDSSFGHCGPYKRWQVVYNHRPWIDSKPTWLIEGGAVCQWTELMGPEETDVRLWPRGAALGERLWTDPKENVTADVTLRMDTQRTRMVDRGIRAAPLWPRWCSQNPRACL